MFISLSEEVVSFSRAQGESSVYTFPRMCSGTLGAVITRKEEAHRQWSLDRTPCGAAAFPGGHGIHFLVYTLLAAAFYSVP